MRTDKRSSQKPDKKAALRARKGGVVGYSKKSALLEEAITYMNTGKYGRSSAALKELLAVDPHNTEARRLFATLHLRLGSLVTARQAFESLANEAIGRQDYWLAESLLREYLAAGPRCVPFLEQLAYVYQEKGDELAAVNELGKAIEILRDDPDPDSPQKAAQLYAKIRELAPASPVAIQLASLFDVQTGEFLVRHAAAAHPHADSDLSTSQQNGMASVSVEPVAPEVMPWEQTDEPTQLDRDDSIQGQEGAAAADMSLMPILPSAPESGLSFLPESMIRQDEPLASVSDVVEATPEVVAVPDSHPDNVSNNGASLLTPSLTVEREMQEGIDHSVSSEPVEESVKSGSTPMPWDQIGDASLKIEEAEPPSLTEAPFSLGSIPSSFNSEGPHYVGSSSSEPTAAPVLDPIPTSQSQGCPPSEPAPVPPPMPWDQVADAALAIPESEPSLPIEPASPESILSNLLETEESHVPPLPAEAGPLPPSEAVSESPSFPQSVEEPEPPVAAAPSQTDPAIESTPENSQASSFSWHSVFDKAWKFAAGPVAPSEPVPLVETPETSPELRLTEPYVEPGPDDPGSVSQDMPSAQSDEWATNTVTTIPTPMTSSPVESGPAPSIDEPPLFADSPPSPIATDIESNGPLHEESPVAHLPDCRLAPAPDSDSLAAIPASFSTVVDAQDIPEAEPVPFPSEILSPAVEQVSSQQSPSVHEPEPVPSMTAIVTDPPAQPAHASPPVSDKPLPEPTKQDVDLSSHWNTGEVAVQVHRPSPKKKRGEKDPEGVVQPPSAPTAKLESLTETLSEALREWESEPVQATPPPVVEEVVAPPEDTRPEWMQATDAITFTSSGRHTPRIEPVLPAPVPYDEPEPAPSVAESAVDVLFSPGRTDSYSYTQDAASWAKPRPRFVARLHRVRIGVASFIGSCFSTTRSITFVAMTMATATVVVAALGVGGLGVVWMAMEEPPSGIYQSLTINPPRLITDPKKNGYFLLLGFDAPTGQDPLQAGYERKVSERDMTAGRVCISGDDPKDGISSAGASGHVVKGWFRSGDPLAQLKGQGETLRTMVAGETSSLSRYQKWVTMSFDDWGYGQVVSPDCARVLLAHRLFLLDGFNQNPATGLDRLEADLQSWRTVLAQSKTLATKMLAVAAVQDDAAVVSSLLSRSELDGTSLTRLSKMVRPLDQLELSVRWPMQSHFVWATKSAPAELKQDKSQDRPWYVSMVAAMRLPVQRRANVYADYYEASNKAIAEGRHANLPKLPASLRTPATGPLDYVTNPIENIVGLEPLPGWGPYVMQMMETDAQLRLAGLQAWIRRGPQEGDLHTRLAKAGHAFYDPFTGLPILVNQRKGLLYSVGRDGKDQEGDRTHDVVVAIPSVQSASAESKRSTTISPVPGL